MDGINPIFWNPETNQSLTLEELKVADPETQKDVMRYWFFSNYEHPAESTPYESREGGYIYIWGGPYDANWELRSVFDGHVPGEVIDSLVEELESQSCEWAGTPSEDDYDDYFSSVILSNTEFHKAFLKNLEKISALLDAEVDKGVQQSLLKLLCVSIITALETFLSDAFINTVLGDRQLVRKFVESNPEYVKQKFPLSELFSKAESIEDEVRKHLLSQIWHNLEKVKPMYKATLEIDFPDDLKDIFRAILIRHDIVHRNGKSKNGDEISITKEDVQELMEQVRVMVKHIDDQFDNEDLGDESGITLSNDKQ